MGVLQPVVDGGKLISKIVLLDKTLLSCSLIFIVFMRRMSLMVFNSYEIVLTNNFLIVPVPIRISIVYIAFLLGWRRNNVYGFIGGLRRSSQIIAYDVVFSFLIIMIFMLLLNHGSKLKFMVHYTLDLPTLRVLIIIIETNRSPYDSAEGESELVSGSNVEYIGALFAFLLIAEYGIVIFFSWLSRLLILNSIILILPIPIILIIRGFIPRRRYDLVMRICWKFLFIYPRLTISKILLLRL